VRHDRDAARATCLAERVLGQGDHATWVHTQGLAQQALGEQPRELDQPVLRALIRLGL
jgi:hypothetical protein